MPKNDENCQLYAETTWVCFQNILHIVYCLYIGFKMAVKTDSLFFTTHLLKLHIFSYKNTKNMFSKMLCN